MSASSAGRFFESFAVGETIEHATPRTITTGDQAVYTALYGSRFAAQSSDEFARSIGLPSAPIDDWLVFHIVLGKTVPDLSLNAIANLGYAAGQLLRPVFPGDTLRARSKVVGLKENSNGKSGIVYVRSEGLNQSDQVVLAYNRWVMVRKQGDSPPPPPVIPTLPESVPADDLALPADLAFDRYDTGLSGSNRLWDDYKIGEKIDHVDGVTVEESEHAMATRLYQNTARVHFNQFSEKQGRFGRRLVYGGHAISLARSLSFNGLANAQFIVALNGGRHVSPLFAGDTVFAWSEILGKAKNDALNGAGALRLRLVATKDEPCRNYPFRNEDGKYHPSVILDLDYWALMPRGVG